MRELLLYLSRNQSDYKFGLPLPGAAKSSGKMLFIFEGDSAENREFLNAVVEKGFKQKSEDQSFMAVEDATDDRLLNADRSGAEWRLIVVFGQKLADRLQPGKSKVIVAPEIKKVRESQDIKKQLWVQIKDL